MHGAIENTKFRSSTKNAYDTDDLQLTNEYAGFLLGSNVSKWVLERTVSYILVIPEIYVRHSQDK